MLNGVLVIPRRFQTWMFTGFFWGAAVFFIVLAVAGVMEIEPVEWLLFVGALVAPLVAIGGWFLIMGSFRLDGGRVHAGWPWSRWVDSDEVKRIDYDGTAATGGLVTLELVDGSAVKLVVVNPTFILSSAEVERIEHSLSRLRRSLGFG